MSTATHEILAALEARATAAPDAVALSCGADALTLPELLQAANQIAVSLATEDLQPGDRVAIWMPPSINYLIVLLAVWKAGCITVPVHEGFPAALAKDMAAEVGARLLVVTEAGVLQFQPRAGSKVSTPLPADAAMVAFSSGSGGRAKPVLLAGGRVVISDIGQFWRDFRQQRPTRIACQPGILKTLLDTAPIDLATNPRLRSWVCTGDLPSAELQRQFQARLGQPLGIAYGLIEAGPCALNPVAAGLACVLFWEGDELADAELLGWLRRHAHGWVIPDRMHRLSTWPMTRAGKLDRDALRALNKQRTARL